jgi:hypothetical protein
MVSSAFHYKPVRNEIPAPSVADIQEMSQISEVFPPCANEFFSSIQIKKPGRR